MPDLFHLEAQRVVLVSIQHTKHSRTLTSKGLGSQGKFSLQGSYSITERVQGRVHSQGQTPEFLRSPYNRFLLMRHTCCASQQSGKALKSIFILCRGSLAFRPRLSPVTVTAFLSSSLLFPLVGQSRTEHLRQPQSLCTLLP